MKVIKEATTKYGFPFIAYIPENLSANPALIVHLHGAGERGDGENNLDVVLVNGFPQIANDDNLKDCILLMPRCPENSFWAVKAESIVAFIDAFAKDFSVDENRIYLCGLSMGGFGTWYTAMAFPQKFAAIAPCCGGGMAWNAGVLKMPIWAFHGLDDNVVSATQTIEMVNALKDVNPELKYTLYEGVGHDSWKLAFSEELLEWMLEQHK
ncbi:MAG: dienelactone hydrolase family protein [Clostridia bacterium]|nr:dienelactone hydrolase family protein [Clostridia bacterium]